MIARAIAAFALILLYCPLVVLVLYSFLPAPGSPDAALGGWTAMWYRKVFSNDQILDAWMMSVWVGVWSTLIATVVGTAAAFALERFKFPGKKLLSVMTHVPLIMPEIVMGLSLLIWFVFLKITLGALSMILAHVTFSVSYVIITVRTRLNDMDPTLDEAALDLGATPWQAFWRVTFPLILPGIMSGALMAFTLSFDDFLITFFTTGVGTDTLPLKIYSMIKFGVSPEINALSTVMILITLSLVVGSFLMRRGVKQNPFRSYRGAD